MKKVKIGIPRALLYYRYGVLWKTFFEKIGCKVIVSPETNQKILNLGIVNTIDNCCLSYKIYIGHAMYLASNCDYIIVSKTCDYGKKDKVCPRFNDTYDNLKHLIPKEKILTYKIEHTKYYYQFLGLIKIGFKLTKNPIKILYGYFYAKKKQKNYNQNKYNENKNKLLSNNKKILILSHFYNIQDKFISGYIKDYLIRNDITPILSSNLDSKTATFFSGYSSDTLNLKYLKEMIGAMYYYKHQIDGIIFISTYRCETDEIINNLVIYKNKDVPTLNLIIDEYTNYLSLETKLESFVDIIKGAYCKYNNTMPNDKLKFKEETHVL